MGLRVGTPDSGAQKGRTAVARDPRRTHRTNPVAMNQWYPEATKTLSAFWREHTLLFPAVMME